MKRLTLDVKPLNLTYGALVYDDDTGRAEYMGPISTDSTKIATFILENNVDYVQIFGNERYTKKIKERLDNELTQRFKNYSSISPISVELKGVIK